jgi:hypothetical protein
MKIYVATRIANKTAGLQLADQLTQLGIEVTSRWLWLEEEARPVERSGPRWEAFCEEWGSNDVQDLVRADSAVFLSVPGGMRGTFVEFGLALATNKKIHWVGDRNFTVFTRLATTLDGTPITYHDDVEQFLSSLKEESCTQI